MGAILHRYATGNDIKILFEEKLQLCLKWKAIVTTN